MAFLNSLAHEGKQGGEVLREAKGGGDGSEPGRGGLPQKREGKGSARMEFRRTAYGGEREGKRNLTLKRFAVKVIFT